MNGTKTSEKASPPRSRRRNAILAVAVLMVGSLAVLVLAPTVPFIFLAGETFIFLTGVVTGLTWRMN